MKYNISGLPGHETFQGDELQRTLSTLKRVFEGKCQNLLSLNLYIYPKDDLIRAWRALYGRCNQKGRRFRSDIKIVVDQNQHDDYHEIGEMQLHDNHLKLGAEENDFG